MKLVLFEFRCIDCSETLLLERDKEPTLCSYCGGDIDYTYGKIEPVLEYTPRQYRQG